MKTYIYSILIAVAFAFVACAENDDKAEGNPIIDIKTNIAEASFGDSIEFTVAVSDDEVPLSTLKAFLYYSDELVSETVIRTKTNGNYTSKIFVPYYANIPNGTATLKFVLQNINLSKVEKNIDLPLTRPDFPYLTIVTKNEEIRMERTALYQYEAKQEFPSKVNGYIKAPIVSANGNEMVFGWEGDAVKEASTNEIPYSNLAGEYAITFNTLTYQTAPFIISYAINDVEMIRVDDNNFKVEQNYTKGQEIVVSGIEDVDSWWIDSDYISKDGTALKFAAMDGKYRITANFELKYFIVEAMLGSDLATLQADGTGAIWIIGDNVGKPSLENTTGWDTAKALCMAPIGDKKYQITLVGGTNVSLESINFKFFHQKNWGGEFSNASISTTSDIIIIGDGTNGRDPGNLGLAEGVSLTEGKVYVLTIDLSEGVDMAVLTVQEN